MSANPNLHVSMKRFYFADKERKLPRAEVTVEGYKFIFACDKTRNPVRVAMDGYPHAQIKRTAHAHAAVLFKEHLPEDFAGMLEEVQRALF